MKSQAQIFALTIFIIVVLLASTFVLLLPINQQLIRIRKLLNTFQALSYAESGIEFGNYYGIKNVQLGNFSISSGTSDFNNSQCFVYATKIGYWDFNKCYVIIMTTSTSNITVKIYNSTFETLKIERVYIKAFGVGDYKGVQRILDFDFLP